MRSSRLIWRDKSFGSRAYKHILKLYRGTVEVLEELGSVVNQSQSFQVGDLLHPQPSTQVKQRSFVVLARPLRSSGETTSSLSATSKPTRHK